MKSSPNKLTMKIIVVLALSTPLLTGCGLLTETIKKMSMANDIMFVVPIFFAFVVAAASLLIFIKFKTKGAFVFLCICAANCIIQFFGIFGYGGILNPKPFIISSILHYFGILYFAVSSPNCYLILNGDINARNSMLDDLCPPYRIKITAEH